MSGVHFKSHSKHDPDQRLQVWFSIDTFCLRGSLVWPVSVFVCRKVNEALVAMAVPVWNEASVSTDSVSVPLPCLSDSLRIDYVTDAHLNEQ